MFNPGRIFYGFTGIEQTGLTFEKGGSGGKWQTPHQKARKTEQVELGRTLEVNDAGIWVTYARGMKGKAIAEFKNLCNEVRNSLMIPFQSIGRLGKLTCSSTESHCSE